MPELPDMRFLPNRKRGEYPALDDLRRTILTHSTAHNPVKELKYKLDDYKRIYEELRDTMSNTKWKVPIVPPIDDDGKESVYFMGVRIVLDDRP